MRAPTCVPALAALLVGGGLAGCGPDRIDATFTSRVVQHETCKTVGDHPQVCTREESVTDERVRLVERDDQNVWLYGIPRNGVSDRAILGTRDSAGGYLFVDQVVQENSSSTCTLTDRLEISISVDPDASTDKIGSDPCISLLGRENESTDSSPGCDNVDEPPVKTVLVANRRWEKPLDCSP